MDFLRDKKNLIFLKACFFFLFFFIDPAHSFILPPGPCESTDSYALLNPASDGTITQILVKVKTSGEDPLGPGELWAILQYKLFQSSGGGKFYSAASKPVSVSGLSNTASALIEFDFSNEPIPSGTYHRMLFIYFQETPESLPMLLAEYRPEQLLLSAAVDAYQPRPPPPGGTLVLGPITFLRKREALKTEKFPFPIPDASGPFLLRLTNGTQEGTNRISSAVIKLNGKEVFRPSEFNQNVAELGRQVTLLSGGNLLEVRLRSAPGSFITLELFHLDKQACEVLDIHTFKRGKGKPLEETLEFELGPQFFGPFTLHLTNGTADGYQRVDSAKIKLNGQLVFEPNDFNEQVKEVSRTVSLLSRNKLSVELRGAPGDFLTLGIVGYDHTPPVVTITSPLNGAVFNAGPITVSGVVDDPSASVKVDGATASVGPDGSFALDGITLAEGENPMPIRVVATDSCGNQGEDQILVYLRTLPQGPSLILCAEPFREQDPAPPGENCSPQAFGSYYGVVTGLTDETAISVTLNGILMRDGTEINEQGDIFWGMREGTFFWAFVNIPQVDGIHPFTAIATNAEGGQTRVAVTFVRDTVGPQLTITSPQNYFVTNSPTITITGTVDDPEAIVRLGSWGPIIPVANGTFTIEYTLRWEGWNSLSFSARDPAGNTSYAYLTIILDTIPPQISITNPTEGKAVNTQALNVTGSIIDANRDTVTIEVNNSSPQPLTLTGSTFSGTVTLSPGTNTLAFNATDKAGNSTRVTRAVTLDIDPPAVTITSPISGAIVSRMVTITVESNDGTSGIASVALLVDGQLQSTIDQPPFDFALATSVLSSGMHTITVRAVDGAGNQTEASVDVTVDNTAPIVTITSPVSGAFVSGLITVSVQANDALSEIASVSLYMDGMFRTTLAQPPFNFPLNTLLFASGSHTITAVGIDRAGNQGEASVAILFDHETPGVAITAPAAGAMVSGIITVSVEASDSISGVTGVALYVDSQLHSTLSQPPYSFSVDTSGLAPGSHNLTAIAIDRAGNHGETSITIMVVDSIRIEITAPTNGATINKSSTIVQGRIYNQTGEIGVVVNGILAEVQGSDFAVIVPLQPGQNIITATATRPDGVQGQTSITINTETQQEFIRLTATPTSGILDQTGILNVTFEAEAYLVNPVSGYSWDFNGDGSPEITGTEAMVMAPYQYPGLYFPKVMVTDSQGNIYSETTLVNVHSREEMDALLKAKWEGMKGALSQGNINEALNYFVTDSREEYREIFEVLAPQLPALVSAMREINMVEIKGNLAEYYIKRFQREVDISYFIYFMRDENGIWRISSF